ncbi:glycosyltransferase [uncultured Sphingomonas sp.]|uniref:glycosyltransferase n=1 Tax=uncultured Sphingomonas sp. TaxID=158754 RepID=UPI002609B3E0|nr:glycosyltransferase [uncultured Sphingomonas sp.]
MPARHVLTYAQALRGGVERAQLRLIRGWLDAGRDVTLLLGEEGGAFAGELPDTLRPIRCGRLAVALPRTVADLRPDILFCPGNHYTGLAAWTRLRLGPDCPPIVAKMSNACHRPDFAAPVRWGHARWLAAHRHFLDGLVAMTPATAAEATAATGMAAAVIPNPPAPTPPVRSPPARRTIVGVGRLEPQKRWDRLIAALPHLDDDIRLVIHGEGSLHPLLEAQIARAGLQDRVALPGHAADPLAAMMEAHVVALVSDYEGVPGVLREALSVGRPVVATASSPAVAEIVATPLHGTVVDRDDARALVAALRHWLTLGTPMPHPVAPPGHDAPARYLALFDRIVAIR